MFKKKSLLSLRNSHLILTTALVNKMKSLHIEKSEDYHWFHFILLGLFWFFMSGFQEEYQQWSQLCAGHMGWKEFIILMVSDRMSLRTTAIRLMAAVPRVLTEVKCEKRLTFHRKSWKHLQSEHEGVESLKRVILLLLVQFIQSMRIGNVRNLFFFLPLPIKQSDAPLSDSVRQKIWRIKVAGIYE